MSNNLDLYRFYVGWCRYSGGSSTPWVACAIYSDGSVNSEKMAEAFYDLDGGDTEASDAMEFIEKNSEVYVFANTPSEAIKLVEHKVLQQLID
jgi:hypothetical protein